MSYEYLSYDGTEPKMSTHEIFSAFYNGAEKPLHFIETLCYHLNLPVDDLTLAILSDHIYTPDYENNFFAQIPNKENLKFYQMTDFEGFQRLVIYSKKREKCLKELQKDLINQIKGTDK